MAHRSRGPASEYFVGSHLPSPINHVRFDELGQLLVAGDVHGGLHAWSAQFPGAWGYKSHPDITFRENGTARAHAGAVTGLSVSENMVISCSSDGSVSFWDLKDADHAAVLHPCSNASFLGVPLCLCGAEGGAFVGFKDGSVRKVVMSEGKCSDSIALPPAESGVPQQNRGF
eukprot:Skav213455  [mRNA]  locus=scaffold837:705256:706466:- [translate_table: standard]